MLHCAPTRGRAPPMNARQGPPTTEPALTEALVQLGEAVATLESALAEGRLPEALAALEAAGQLPEPLVLPYARLVRAGDVGADTRRAAALVRLLERARRELVHVEVRFEAALRNGPAGAGLVAFGQRGEVWVRMDQVAAARIWGIAFVLEPGPDRDRVERYLVNRASQGLASGLVGVEKIQRRLLGRELAGDLAFLPPTDGADFEQLVLDVLNEHRPLARHAPLHEDFFEKTDLRLHLAELGRRRGARVQVTRSVSPGAHAAKVDSIRRPEEVVLISPLALARAARGPAAKELVGAETLERLWPLLPSPRASDTEAAHTLRDLLLAALQRRHAGPRGPLLAVPEPLRLLIQAHTIQEARRTTHALRRRQAAARTEGTD